MATNAFGTPTNLNQFNAIVNGSKSNSLVNQLFAGKMSQTTPMVSSPNVVAASSQVKSPSQVSAMYQTPGVPQPIPTGPQSTIPNTMSGTNGAPMSGPAAGPASLLPPTNQPVTSHSVTDGQGNTVTQKYDTSANTIADTSNAPPTPPTPPSSFTTPSGATVDANGNTLSSAPVSALSSITSGLVNNAGNNAAIGQSAADIAAKYGKQIADVGNQAAINEETVGGQGLLPTAMGRAQQIATTANSAENALASGESAALQGTSQELTANSNAASALNNAGNLATPANQFLSTSYGNQVLDSNGKPVGGTGDTLQTAVSNAINQIKAGGGYQNAAATLSSFGPAGTNALLTALGPSFNINASNAEAAAQASNINTQGTLNTTIGAQGAQQATTNYVNAKTAYDTASKQATNLQNTLASTGINNNPQFVNQKINALQNQLGSANYASFITTLNETKQAYTNLLSSVGASTPTVNGQAATDIFNANSTPAQINAAIDALNQASYTKLQPLYDQIGTYSNIGTSGSGSSSTANPWH